MCGHESDFAFFSRTFNWLRLCARGIVEHSRGRDVARAGFPHGEQNEGTTSQRAQGEEPDESCKDEARKKWGEEQVHIWRRSYDIAPPGGESLKDTVARVLPYYCQELLPSVLSGQRVIVVGPPRPTSNPIFLNTNLTRHGQAAGVLVEPRQLNPVPVLAGVEPGHLFVARDDRAGVALA